MNVSTLKTALCTLVLSLSVAVLPAYAASKVSSQCTYKGIRLNGKVKVVERGGDIKVQVKSSFPDLKVQQVTSFPNKCGQWQFVTSFPDFTVQFVDSFPDITIKYVNAFPGRP